MTDSNGQPQDLSCPSCVSIPKDEIELYKSLFPLIVWTDNDVYDHNSAIMLNGYLRPGLEFNPVTLQVTNPIGNIVAVEQIVPQQDGSFSITLNTAGKLWEKDGNYIIKAQSGPERVFKTQIKLISAGVGVKSTCQNDEITIYADNGGIYCIEYETADEITGIDGTLSTSTKTISLDVRGRDYGSLQLVLPRHIIDSQADGKDTKFVIMQNDELIEYQEIENTPTHRIISIPISPDRQVRIDIVGTSIVPEFGIITMIVLGTALGTMVILAKRRIPILYK